MGKFFIIVALLSLTSLILPALAAKGEKSSDEDQVSQGKVGGRLGFFSKLTSFGRSSSSKTNEVKKNVDQSVHNKEQNMKNMIIPNTPSAQSVHNDDELRLIESHSNKDVDKKHEKVKKHYDENKSHSKSHKNHKKDEDYEKHGEKKHKKSKKHRDDDQDEVKKEHKKKNKKHHKHHDDD